MLLEILQEGIVLVFVKKCHRSGDRRGQSGAFSGIFVPGTQNTRSPFQFCQMGSKSSTVKLCTRVARDIVRRYSAGVCEKVSPGRG